jgi:hypothetical protein
MISTELDLINKRIDILFRKQRGDTITAIADHYAVCRYNIVRHIKKGLLCPKVVEGARLMQLQIDKDLFNDT